MDFFTLFGLKNNLGLVLPYKFLRGNTSGTIINSTRVLSTFTVKHPTNYKNEFFRDLGAFDVRYRRRRRARFGRTLFGSVRKR